MEWEFPPTIRPESQTRVWHRGRWLTYFAGCDYLRLSVHPESIRAAQAAAAAGLSISASRITTGNHPTLRACERELARFFQAERALITAHGYGVNLAVAQAMGGRFSHALLDERAHVSLQDATVFLGAVVQEFRHCDVSSLQRVYRTLPPEAHVVVMTDGMFPLEGTVPPLPEYHRALGPQVWWWIDDCHAVGTLGARGRGSLEHHGLPRARTIQTITLSKALGAFGGALLADTDIVAEVWRKSRWFAGSTPPPLSLIAAARIGLRLLSRGPSRVNRLRRNVAWVKEPLVEAGVLGEMSPGPMFLVTPKSSAEARRLRRRLLAADIYPPFIRYPGGPGEGAFRFAISSEHGRDELKRLVDSLIGKPE